MNSKLNHLHSIIITVFFLVTLNSLEGNKDKPVKKACFKAPIYVYDEEQKKYYRQDWCYLGKTIIYFDSIPVPSSGEEVNNVSMAS